MELTAAERMDVSRKECYFCGQIAGATRPAISSPNCCRTRPTSAASFWKALRLPSSRASGRSPMAIRSSARKPTCAASRHSRASWTPSSMASDSACAVDSSRSTAAPRCSSSTGWRATAIVCPARSSTPTCISCRCTGYPRRRCVRTSPGARSMARSGSSGGWLEHRRLFAAVVRGAAPDRDGRRGHVRIAADAQGGRRPRLRRRVGLARASAGGSGARRMGAGRRSVGCRMNDQCFVIMPYGKKKGQIAVAPSISIASTTMMAYRPSRAWVELRAVGPSR